MTVIRKTKAVLNSRDRPWFKPEMLDWWVVELHRWAYANAYGEVVQEFCSEVLFPTQEAAEEALALYLLKQGD